MYLRYRVYSSTQICAPHARRQTNMATKKVTRSVRKKQSVRSRGQKTREQATGNRLQGKSKTLKSYSRSGTTKKPSPGEFALRERTLPGRRFVEFPLVQGKIAEKVQLFTTSNCHSLTIEFQNRTSLHLEIEPGFTVNAQFMRSEKGELVTLAEWPPIHISSEQP